jgi:hypothetical protein
MKHALEPNELPQPPPDAALMSASEYRLWQLSLQNSSSHVRRPSEPAHNEEIDEAWRYITNDAGELLEGNPMTLWTETFDDTSQMN